MLECVCELRTRDTDILKKQKTTPMRIKLLMCVLREGYKTVPHYEKEVVQ